MTSPEGDLLTEAHRRQQLRIATVAAMRTRRDYTRLVVPERPQTRRLFVDQTIRNIMEDRSRSRAAASNYFRRMIQIEAPGTRYTPPPLRETDPNIEQRLRRSLYVTGAARPRRHEEAGRLRRAEEVGRSGVMGAAIRHTLNAGRDRLMDEVRDTRVATGYVRVTAMDRNVCWFCAMLASRTDYKERSFDKSDPRFKIGGNPFASAKVHDHCRCMLRPVFDHDTPERTKYYEDLWYELSEGADDLAANFRRNWEAMVSSAQ